MTVREIAQDSFLKYQKDLAQKLEEFLTPLGATNFYLESANDFDIREMTIFFNYLDIEFKISFINESFLEFFVRDNWLYSFNVKFLEQIPDKLKTEVQNYKKSQLKSDAENKGFDELGMFSEQWQFEKFKAQSVDQASKSGN